MQEGKETTSSLVSLRHKVSFECAQGGGAFTNSSAVIVTVRESRCGMQWWKVAKYIYSGTVFKGIVHPKMKIQSLSTHTHADGRVGEVF